MDAFNVARLFAALIVLAVCFVFFVAFFGPNGPRD